jgi:hypothetical protein
LLSGDSQSMQRYSGLNPLEFKDRDSSFIADDSLSETSDFVKAPPYKIGWSQDDSYPPSDISFSLEESEVAAEKEETEIEDPSEVVAVIGYEDWRDGTSNLNVAWTKLDASINGPDWSPTNRVWMTLPIIVQQHRSEAEANLMFRLCHDIHQLH